MLGKLKGTKFRGKLTEIMDQIDTRAGRPLPGDGKKAAPKKKKTVTAKRSTRKVVKRGTLSNKKRAGLRTVDTNKRTLGV